MAARESYEDLGEEQHFEMDLDDLTHLLVPPEQDPFSDRPMEYMGQSAVERMLHIFRPSRLGKRSHIHLVLRMPPEKAGPGTAEKAKELIVKYGSRRTQDNHNLLRRIRRKGLRQIPTSLAILFVCIALGVFFGLEVFQESTPLLSFSLSEGFYIIGWVALWGPIDTLLFEPVDVKKENELLQLLMAMEIKVVPAP